MMGNKYLVTLYNQAIGFSISAPGRSRRDAFERALARAGEGFMRAPLLDGKPRDILTTLRILFFEHLMTSHNRSRTRVYAESLRGCGVEFRRIDTMKGTSQ